MLALTIANNQKAFGPGEKVEGVAKWELQEVPEHVRVYLIWFTEGKGDEDTAIVDHVELGAKERRGEEPFSFTLPEGPFSFEGRLISLQWALELVSEEPISVDRKRIMVSPWVKKLVLDTADDDDD